MKNKLSGVMWVRRVDQTREGVEWVEVMRKRSEEGRVRWGEMMERSKRRSKANRKVNGREVTGGNKEWVIRYEDENKERTGERIGERRRASNS